MLEGTSFEPKNRVALCIRGTRRCSLKLLHFVILKIIKHIQFDIEQRWVAMLILWNESSPTESLGFGLHLNCDVETIITRSLACIAGRRAFLRPAIPENSSKLGQPATCSFERWKRSQFSLIFYLGQGSYTISENTLKKYACSEMLVMPTASQLARILRQSSSFRLDTLKRRSRK